MWGSFSFLCDITGRLFQSRKPNLRDMNGNCEAGSLENLIWGLVEKLETLRSVDPINEITYIITKRDFKLGKVEMLHPSPIIYHNKSIFTIAGLRIHLFHAFGYH